MVVNLPCSLTGNFEQGHKGEYMKYSFQFSLLTGLMVFATLMANILSTLVQPYAVGPFTLSGGFIVFPLVYVLSDVFSEVYGYGPSRRIAWVSMAANLLMSFAFLGMYALLGGEKASGIEQLAKFSWVIVLASLVAGQLGDWANDVVFTLMRQNMRSSFLARALLSSVAGQSIDSIIFVFGGLVVAFGVPFQVALTMVISQVMFKLLVEAAFFPLTVALKRLAIQGDEGAYRPTYTFSIFGDL